MLAIVDYGIGNVRSVQNAFAYVGAPAELTRDPGEIERADALILPGVGAFGEGMRRIDEHGLSQSINTFARSGKPLLGICLGFQMLMRFSEERGEHAGLNLLPFDVVKLPVDQRLPHIGWASVEVPDEASQVPRLMKGLDGESFYFVHSYAVIQRSFDVVSAICSYGQCDFMALVEQGNIFGTQFHPEKSGEAGLEMLRNFVRLTK